MGYDLDFIIEGFPDTAKLNQGKFCEPKNKKNLFIPDSENPFAKRVQLYFTDDTHKAGIFTISDIAIDSSGKVYCSPQAWNDLCAGKLSLKGKSPLNQINNDTVKLLYTIKYMAFGFVPDQDLLSAIKHWEQSPQFSNKAHFMSVLYSEINKPDDIYADKFFRTLDEYGITKAIYGQEFKDLSSLRYFLNHPPSQDKFYAQGNYHPGLFAHSAVEGQISTIPRANATIFSPQ